MSLRDVWQKLFDTFVWYNFPSTSSPVNAANLNKMNTAIDGIDDRVLELKTGLDGVTEDLEDKVDKEQGKGLSTNDYDNTAKGIVDGVTSALDDKVDKEAGKGLSTEDFTTTEKTKLAGISAEANKVEITPVVTEGTTLATVTIDGVDIDIKGSNITVDSAISPTSTNPLQNKVIYETLQSILHEETAEGNPISISDASGLNAKECSVAFAPVQDLHGQSAPYPAGGGKNKLPLTVSGIKSLNTGGSWSGNIYTRNGVTYELLTNSVNAVIGIKVNGTANGNSSLTLSKDTACLNTNTAYRVNGASEDASVNTYRWQININESTFLIAVEDSDQSVTTPATIDKFDSYIVVLSGVQVTNKIFYPMIRLATEADSTFAPYSNICPISGWDSLELSRCGKNLFDKSTAKNNTYVSYTGEETLTNGFYCSDFIRVKQGNITTNTIATGVSKVVIYKADKTIKRSTSQLPVTIESDEYYIRINGKTSDISIDDVQVEYGDTNTDFVAYQGQTHTATFSDTVYGGKVVWKDGVVKTVITNKKMPINPNNLLNGGQSIYYVVTSDMKSGNALDGLCDTFTTVSNSLYYGVRFGANNSNIYLYKLNENIESISDLESAKQWLTDNTVNVCYELATPQEITLTAEQIELLKGQNVLWTDSNGNITLKYSADIKAYIDSQLNS